MHSDARLFFVYFSDIWWGFVLFFSELYEKALSKLQISNLIERKMDGSLLSLSFGAVMAKYFLSISTMDTFQRVRLIEYDFF